MNTNTPPNKKKSADDSKDKSAIYVDLNELRRLKYLAKGFSFTPNQPANSALSGKNVSKLRGRGLNFEELRHYRPGDDIRSMDWKVTQRTGKPHIKVFTEERERNVFLAIDQRMTMFFGSSNKMKSVIAAELSALIAWQISDSGDRIGAVIYNDQQTKVIPAKRGRQHVVNLLAEVLKKNHELSIDLSSKDNAHQQVDDSESYNKMLATLNKVSSHNGLIILIGDGHGFNDKSTDFVKQLRQHNEVIACHIFDPLEQTLPKMSQMIVSDGVQQIQFSSEKKHVQKNYEAEIARQLESYVKAAKKYRIPLIEIDTIAPVEQQLRKALGHKAGSQTGAKTGHTTGIKS
ncbi:MULTISPECIES: DUF58 domain-containing protein [Colwellia]|uniref:DUF58 domain-containing protein n=1 Tax=Colwellia psychrerythraea (strain 34H / ATCC BAA-681) TaxID=167879 RepID=Q47ZT0_COLP3|nr:MULTISPECIES: DUF58 domain-containing protein [Colwellia]AAZ26041.1 hypothetical protein CPS_2989 [Colwellia psychrerythraea 34H]PKH87305.1 DUF58 domain-containing protein [Colwellia sp. Bg11-28]